MKLRNKKTGEVIEVNALGLVFNRHNQPFDLGKYASIKELTEEWEDYTTPEPLIKDEKIRKAVRAWAEANQPKFITSNGNYTACDNRGLMIEFNKSWTACMQNGERYTIAELCGEEEE